MVVVVWQCTCTCCRGSRETSSETTRYNTLTRASLHVHTHVATVDLHQHQHESLHTPFSPSVPALARGCCLRASWFERDRCMMSWMGSVWIDSWISMRTGGHVPSKRWQTKQPRWPSYSHETSNRVRRGCRVEGRGGEDSVRHKSVEECIPPTGDSEWAHVFLLL